MAICDTCGNDCRILGHGIEANQGIYCCAHCAREAGNPEVSDRYPVPDGA